MKILPSIACSAILLFSSANGFASAFSPTAISDSLAPYDITSGWDFQLTTSFRITALDYYDSGAAGGLLTNHEVALWTSGGALLATATVPAGSSAPLIGSYRSVAIPPIILPPGFYEVGAFVTGYSDKYVYDSMGSTLPGIFYYESHVAVGPFAFPGSQNLVSTREITANFEAVAVVPEPQTATLLIAGLIAVCIVTSLPRGKASAA